MHNCPACKKPLQIPRPGHLAICPRCRESAVYGYVQPPKYCPWCGELVLPGEKHEPDHYEDLTNG